MSPGLQLLGPSVSVRLEGEEGREGVLPRPVHLLTQYVGGRWSLCLQFNSQLVRQPGGQTRLERRSQGRERGRRGAQLNISQLAGFNVFLV